MSATPAGWYPDPGTPGQQRYWDGTAWTDHTAPLVTQPPVAPAQPPAPPHQPQPEYQQQQQQPVYQPAPGYVQPAQPTFGGAVLADWGARLGAAVINFFVRLGLAIPGIILAVIGDTEGSDGLLLLGYALAYIPAWLYSPLMMMRQGEHNGQNLGKQAMGIRVVREDGVQIGFGYAALREVLLKGILFDFVGALFILIPTALNYLWPLWDDGNQALHDKMASTRVVKA